MPVYASPGCGVQPQTSPARTCSVQVTRTSRVARQLHLSVCQPTARKAVPDQQESHLSDQSAAGTKAQPTPSPALPQGQQQLRDASTQVGLVPDSIDAFYESQYFAFTALMACSALIIGSTVFKTTDVLTALGLTSLTFRDIVFLKLLGATAVFGGIVEYCLQDAAKRRMTVETAMEPTYRQLIAAGTTRHLGCVAAALLCTGSTIPPLLSGCLLVASLGSSAVYMATLWFSIRFATPPKPTDPVGYSPLVFGVYCLLAPLYCIKALAAFQPGILFQGDISQSQLLMSMACSGSFLAAALVCVALAEAETKGQLGTQLCKTLNLGLAGMELTSRAVLGAVLLKGGFVSDAVGVSAVGLSVAVAIFCGVQAFWGKLR